MGHARRCKTTTMIAFDILAAALVIAMLGAMLNEDTRDRRIKIARPNLHAMLAGRALRCPAARPVHLSGLGIEVSISSRAGKRRLRDRGVASDHGRRACPPEPLRAALLQARD